MEGGCLSRFFVVCPVIIPPSSIALSLLDCVLLVDEVLPVPGDRTNEAEGAPLSLVVERVWMHAQIKAGAKAQGVHVYAPRPRLESMIVSVGCVEPPARVLSSVRSSERVWLVRQAVDGGLHLQYPRSAFSPVTTYARCIKGGCLSPFCIASLPPVILSAPIRPLPLLRPHLTRFHFMRLFHERTSGGLPDRVALGYLDAYASVSTLHILVLVLYSATLRDNLLASWLTTSLSLAQAFINPVTSPQLDPLYFTSQHLGRFINVTHLPFTFNGPPLRSSDLLCAPTYLDGEYRTFNPRNIATSLNTRALAPERNSRAGEALILPRLYRALAISSVRAVVALACGTLPTSIGIYSLKNFVSTSQSMATYHAWSSRRVDSETEPATYRVHARKRSGARRHTPAAATTYEHDRCRALHISRISSSSSARTRTRPSSPLFPCHALPHPFTSSLTYTHIRLLLPTPTHTTRASPAHSVKPLSRDSTLPAALPKASSPTNKQRRKSTTRTSDAHSRHRKRVEQGRIE
ncbi:hypothetical protein C8R45DRAFT_1159473 [Mycena sanguinolenta]|nr:hypothetical protein C8R45DRAFT_1159473 [Mycena sanguinolenta]